jgi:hypothetical protein
MQHKVTLIVRPYSKYIERNAKTSDYKVGRNEDERDMYVTTLQTDPSHRATHFARASSRSPST